jgi:N-acetylglucosamine-6-phosphate deacetylase
VTNAIEGRIFTGEHWVTGRVEFTDRITDVVACDTSQAEVRTILPGFIDLHVHGGGGRDLMEAGDAAAAVAGLHARHGTTALLATTMTAPPAELATAVAAIGRTALHRPPGAARILGVHLEGPFISSERLGAQPAHTRLLDLNELDALRALAPVRVMTIAPEAVRNIEAVSALRARDIHVQLGHTNISYEAAVAFLTAGVAGITHLFNAMTGMDHRQPGLAAAALAHARHAEIIPDLVHVHAGAIHAALRAIPGLYAVTDATAAAGMPDGSYRLGTQRVLKSGDSVRLPDGTLAGSCLTMDRALRNLVSLGLDLGEASRRLSAVPAAFLGLSDRGLCAPGFRADLVVLDQDLAVRACIIEGERLDL